MNARAPFLLLLAVLTALFVPPEATAAPSAPTGLSAPVSGGQVNLSWGAVSGAISYAVARGTASGGPYTPVNSWVTGGTAYTDVPASAGTYYYVVTATDTTGTSVNSGEASATVVAPNAAPGAVTGLVPTVQTGQVILNWSAVNGSNRAATYNVKRSLVSGGPYTTVGPLVSTTSYVNTGLTTGTTYYYVVSGVNAINEGPNSAQVAATPIAAPADGTVSFADDWYADPVKGGWLANQLVAANRMQRDTSTATPHGFATARVEVRPGDDPINSSGERSEVLNMKSSLGTNITEDGNSGTVYYAMSFMLPTSWQNPVQQGVNSWSIPFQLHGPDTLGASPSFALYANSKFQVSLNGGDLGSGVTGPYFQTYDFVDGALNLGTWTDLIIRITYAQTPTGQATVWRRNQGESTFTLVMDVINVPTLQYKSSISTTAGPHYWKHGLYRQKSTTLTNVLSEGPLARGTSFKAVEWAAFATAVGDPGNAIPAFIAQPQSQTVAASRNAQLTGTAFGSAPLSYQWYFNTTALSDGPTVSGSATNTLALTNVNLANQGSYILVATNVAGSTNSNAATLTVDTSAPNGTLVTDPFTDGSATNTSGGDLLGLVYYPQSATVATVDDSGGIGAGNALQVSPTGTSGKIFAEFNPVTLANAGDFVQLQYDLRFTQQPDNGGANFRFGLYYDFGTLPATATARVVDVGYGCWTNPGAAASGATQVWREGAGDDALGGGVNGGGIVTLASGVASTNLATTKHTAKVRITRQANGDLLVTGTIDGTSVSGTHVAPVLTYTFNVFGIGNGGSTSEPFAIDNVSVTTNPDATGPSGGTVALSSGATSVDAGAALTVTFAGWTDPSLPVSYAVLVDGSLVSAQGASASPTFNATAAAGAHTLTGRIYDAFGNSTDVTQSFTVLSAQETWRRNNFGITTNTGNAADTADPDGDGQNNLFEYIAGLTPTSPASRFNVRIQAVAGQPGQQAIVFSPLVAGRTYVVKSKSSLSDSTWTPLTSSTSSDNGAVRTVTDLGAGPAHKFYMVEITLP